MKGLHCFWRNRNLNRLSVLADKFHIDDMLLVRLVPRHRDHDADPLQDGIVQKES